MISVVKRTGHSSYYVEKGMAAMGKTPSQMGIQGDYRICGGGKRSRFFRPNLAETVLVLEIAFPIWLEVSCDLERSKPKSLIANTNRTHHVVRSRW